MSKREIGGLLKPLLLLLLTAAVALAVTAPVNALGVGVTPAVVNLGTIGRGGSATQEIRIYNTDHNSSLSYTVAAVNASAITVNPSSGSINPDTNITVTVRADVSTNAKDGNYSTLLVVNSTGGSRTGQVIVVPAIALPVKYTVNGTAPAQDPVNTIPTVLLIGAGIIIVLIAAVYVGIRRLR